MKMPNIFVGYEKAWNALFNGGLSAVMTTIMLGVLSRFDLVTAPDETAIIAAVSGFVSAISAAVGAFTATNTTPVHPDDFTSTPKE